MKISGCLFLLTLVAFCLSCNNNDGSTTNQNKSGPDSAKLDSNLLMVRPAPIGVELEKSTERQEKTSVSVKSAPKVKVVIHVMEGYGQDTSFARQAAALLEKVINSPEFEKAVLGETYVHNQGLSPQQIYDRIMQAHEIDGPGGTDGVIDLRLRTINTTDDDPVWMKYCSPNSPTGTIGIDGAGTGIAAVCPQWLRSTAQQNKPDWLAAHFIHEYMHILNFTHPNKKPRSVPYKIHAIVEDLAAKM